MMIRSLSILIPCYNVEATINDVVTRAYTIGKKVTKRLEIIAIDDASCDQTPALLKALSKRIPVLKVITNQINEGYGKTIKKLYTRGRNEWLFSLPGDDQFDASELKKLLPYAAKADMILGLRSTRHDPPFRLFQSHFYNGLLHLLFRLNLHDVNTIRLMKKSLIADITLMSDSAFVDAELAIRAKRKNFITTEVPVTHKARIHKGATGGKFLKTIYPTIVDTARMFFHT